MTGRGFCRLAAAAAAWLIVGAVTGFVLLAVVDGVPDAWWPQIGDAFPPADTTGDPGDPSSSPVSSLPAPEQGWESGIASLLNPPEAPSWWQALPAGGALVFIAAHIRWRRR